MIFSLKFKTKSSVSKLLKLVFSDFQWIFHFIQIATTTTWANLKWKNLIIFLEFSKPNVQNATTTSIITNFLLYGCGSTRFRVRPKVHVSNNKSWQIISNCRDNKKTKNKPKPWIFISFYTIFRASNWKLKTWKRKKNGKRKEKKRVKNEWKNKRKNEWKMREKKREKKVS